MKTSMTILSNSLYLLGERWVTRIARLVYTIVLARKLGPELYGLFNYGISWYMLFLAFKDVGLRAIISRELGQDHDQGAKLVSQTLFIHAGITIIAMVVCGLLGWQSENRRDAQWLLVIFSLALVGRSLFIWNKGVFTAYEANRYIFRQNALFRVLEVLCGIIVAFAGGGILTLAIVHALSWWAQAFYGFTVIHSRLTRWRWQWSWRQIRPLFWQGLLLAGCNAMLTWFHEGPLIGFRLLGGAERLVGQLAVALQAFWVLSQIPAVSNMASLPALSRSVARQDGKDQLFIETMLRMTMIGGTAIVLTGVSLGPWMITHLLGATYLQAGNLVGYSLWLLIPWTAGYSLYTVWLARGRTIMLLMGTAAGALTSTVVMVVCVPFMGFGGALVAMAIGMSVWAGSLLWEMLRAGELNWRFTLLKPGIAVLITVGVFYSLVPFHKWIALPVAMGTLLVSLFVCGGFSEIEKTLLQKVRVLNHCFRTSRPGK